MVSETRMQKGRGCDIMASASWSLSRARLCGGTGGMTTASAAFVFQNFKTQIKMAASINTTRMTQTQSQGLGMSIGGFNARMSVVFDGAGGLKSGVEFVIIRASGVFPAFQKNGPGRKRKADRFAI